MCVDLKELVFKKKRMLISVPGKGPEHWERDLNDRIGLLFSANLEGSFADLQWMQKNTG
jgi:hypothetical protein